MTTIDTLYYKARNWQKASFKKIDRCFVSDECQIMPVNATVGSGKTDLACYAFGKFIEDNIESKTISIFVAPRINLCKQQTLSIAEFIDKHSNIIRVKIDDPNVDDKICKNILNNPAKVGCGIQHTCVITAINCTNQNRNTSSNALSQAAHQIYVYCDASLWGKSSDKEDDGYKRFNNFVGMLNNHVNNKYKLGVIFYDEAHNYDSKRDEINRLYEKLHLSMLASGTPAFYQKNLSKQWKSNVCKCSPKEAIDEGMICKPKLHRIWGDDKDDYPNAIKAVLEYEKRLKNERNEPFRVTILANCNGIDQIENIFKDENNWINNGIGKEFHVIAIHSDKLYTDAGLPKCARSRIDKNNDITSDEAYAKIEKLDTEGFGDDLPVIVFQVGMIGEGINVSSFNSVIVVTQSDKNAMQQIGRALRNYWKDGKSKVNDGHANVYAFIDNTEDLKKLFINLYKNDLTNDCFDWGEQIDITNSSGMVHDEANDIPDDLNNFKWNDIDVTIEQIATDANDIYVEECFEEFADDLVTYNAEQVNEFGKKLVADNYVECCGRECKRSIKDYCKTLSTDFMRPVIFNMLNAVRTYALKDLELFKLMIETSGIKTVFINILKNADAGNFFAANLDEKMISLLTNNR